MFGFENVHWDKLSSGLLEEKCEYEYCLKTFEELRRSFPDFYEYQFYLFSCGKLKIPDSTNYPGKKVLIYLSDESGAIPDKSICDSFLAIFKVYLDESKVKDISNLYGFPLGYSAGVKMEEVKAFDKRTNNVFFSGNLNKRRLLLYYKCLQISGVRFPYFLLRILFYHHYLKNVTIKYLFKHKLNKFDNVLADHSIVRFTDAFKSGMDIHTYSKMLDNTKIVLSPRGFVSSECLRLYEALKMGCIVISEKLPDCEYYKNSPILQVDGWEHIDTLINQLLSDEKSYRR